MAWPPGVYEVKIEGVNVITTVADKSFAVDMFVYDLTTLIHNDNKKKPVVVGLDVEWNSNSTNTRPLAATLQICFGTRCVIIQLLHLDAIPGSLCTFLRRKDIIFVGVGIKEDLAKLEKDYGLVCSSVKELGELARAHGKGHSGAGLANLANEVVGVKIEKPASVTRSDWEARSLNTEQIQYATTDAYASYLIGNKLLAGGVN